MKFARETWILALLCSVDMISTALLLNAHIASEANPILRFYADLGLPAFISVKTLLFFGPLYVLELLRCHRPRFVVGMLRAGIVGYLLVYGIGVFHVNSTAAEAPPQVQFHSKARQPRHTRSACCYAGGGLF